MKKKKEKEGILYKWAYVLYVLHLLMVCIESLITGCRFKSRTPYAFLFYLDDVSVLRYSS